MHSWVLPDSWPIFAEDAPWDSAQADLYARGLTDGLPCVVPTKARLDQMLNGIREPNKPLGAMAPLLGEVNAAHIAYHCVLAGCVPDELPVVLAAALACIQPEFNLLGVQSTTGTAAIALIVHGPITQRLHMNAEANCLGPGNRANACIGRAFRLALTNIGGAYPGIDMATMGQPGKYTFCFAEQEAGPAYPPLHVRRGFDPASSAVTVLSAAGTTEVIPQDKQAYPDSIITPLVAAMIWSRFAHKSSMQVLPPAEQFFLLPPELTNFLAQSGQDFRALQKAIFALAQGATDWQCGPTLMNPPPIAVSPDHIHPIVTGGIGIKMTLIPGWGGGSQSVTRVIEQP